MENKSKLMLFEEKLVRHAWDEENEKYWFSVIDIIEILTEQPSHDRARNYWKVLKHRLTEEGNETVTNCRKGRRKSCQSCP
jgi:hypothetical protein